ncbi:MAG: S26 family signal peptidase [Prosthecochloris sp.]|nr:S26 family signal peptidase [Prosthecochloris sp.]
MRRFYPLLFSLLFCSSLAALAVFFSFPYIIFNTTDSLPHGFYAVRPVSAVNYGDLAVFRVPAHVSGLVAGRGWLREDGFMVKEVAGMAGDRVCTAGGIFSVRGREYGRVLHRDSLGRALPVYQFCGVLRKGVVVVGHNGERSFDSRYFGPVAEDDFIGVARPLWVY